MTALKLAVSQNGGYPEIVEDLLQAGADPNSYLDECDDKLGYDTALADAVKCKDGEIVHQLLSHGGWLCLN